MAIHTYFHEPSGLLYSTVRYLSAVSPVCSLHALSNPYFFSRDSTDSISPWLGGALQVLQGVYRTTPHHTTSHTPKARSKATPSTLQ
jgi:hypothetical protein